jgi:hypothetical protein
MGGPFDSIACRAWPGRPALAGTQRAQGEAPADAKRAFGEALSGPTLD